MYFFAVLFWLSLRIRFYGCQVKHKKLIIINNKIADEAGQIFERPSDIQMDISTISCKLWCVINRWRRNRKKPQIKKNHWMPDYYSS